jgi:hypothetical protein
MPTNINGSDLNFAHSDFFHVGMDSWVLLDHPVIFESS